VVLSSSLSSFQEMALKNGIYFQALTFQIGLNPLSPENLEELDKNWQHPDQY
jgi:hypothetical protein